ncbi:MAG: 2-amino-4-oxopentanoate thiolase subunit OrtA [Aminobacterium sp.]|jgi:hypothetical protein|uniref:2-amino-4-oxopentanoate thiolase subunit OrtA n=1 Tax=unclassified Aminobacterium TaxID=2685012 RepID=UPI0027DC1CA0|nr:MULTISPECIES: 2-amino-4-oxopentanoate thiolase subunit OrtA [unclassified Aminobacterium]MDD2207348.1 2-amino-4-oxopentanoate thiolase subunit OrtA [Aminobacterium sp.]MDD3426766.1 2-amino-4-oxopentanoate thiolase subunit OrtA [Aminobacterium sp.]MDD3708098.1 2-amino-4-oxopentanoate thiolase subunit OrtA [Aminobacterium sp.]MDD4229577.1 2-amino-4-oxopentanoate thiolase subunit OrtA [Aminobacterium sp.]MDD4552159.1 2-amino-4-oxopentanoate thiolase subunit OrtA [Aminobacterium sp.]
MDEKIIKKGSWVQIHYIVLQPSERADNVPQDTKQVPLELWVKGYLDNDAPIGSNVTITTMTDRKVQGTLVSQNPPYTHTFGRQIPELLSVGKELHALISKAGEKA